MVSVGDTIYFKRYETLTARQKVIRITPSGMIKTDSYSMRQEPSGYLRIISSSSWNTLYAFEETEELKAEWREAILKQWIEKHYDDISLEDIEVLKKKYEATQ